MRPWAPMIVVATWGLVALVSPWLALEPSRIALEHILDPPGPGAWLGYDDLGRAVGDRLVVGAQTSLVVAGSAVAVSAGLGSLIGAAAGYRGGWWDWVLMRVVDVFLAFPGILLAIALAGMIGPGIGNVVIALCTVGWVGYARLARAQVLAIKGRDHVQAAIALGVTPVRIVLRHLLPLIAAPLIVEATFGIAAVILAEAGLSFLGLGVQPPQSSWGSMIRDGTRYMLVAPHLVLIPGVALMLVVLAVNRLGDALRDRLDPRLRATHEP